MAQTISDRIQKAAKLRGFTSERSKSHVDVQSLSDATGSSYEMSRRYAEGVAVPGPDVVKKIASWLKVLPSWLLYGDGPMEGASDIDVSILESCLAAAAEAQHIAGVELSDHQRAALVAALYRQASKGAAPSADTVAAALTALVR